MFDSAKQHQSEEQARRKKMSRIEEGFLNNMVKMMEVCNAQGFVYGIIPENGKPVIGAFDSLCEWWKDKVRFDRNGPLPSRNTKLTIQFRTKEMTTHQLP